MSIDATWIPAISAGGGVFAGIVVAVATYWLTRRREHETDWRKLRLAQYQEYLLSLSGIADGRSTDEAQARYADALNCMALVAPLPVQLAVQELQEEISISNQNRSRERHDLLLTRAIRAMRADIHPSLKDADQVDFRIIRPPPGRS